MNETATKSLFKRDKLTPEIYFKKIGFTYIIFI